VYHLLAIWRIHFLLKGLNYHSCKKLLKNPAKSCSKICAYGLISVIECWNWAAVSLGGRSCLYHFCVAARFESRMACWVASHLTALFSRFGFAYANLLDKHRFQRNESADTGAARYFFGTSSTLNGTPSNICDANTGGTKRRASTLPAVVPF